jgi:hypothetical protein
VYVHSLKRWSFVSDALLHNMHVAMEGQPFFCKLSPVSSMLCNKSHMKYFILLGTLRDHSSWNCGCISRVVIKLIGRFNCEGRVPTPESVGIRFMTHRCMIQG